MTFGKHHPHSQRQEHDVNATESDSEEGQTASHGAIRAAVSSHIASSGMKRRSSQKSSGEPSAGNLHAGFCLGRRVQEAMLAR